MTTATVTGSGTKELLVGDPELESKSRQFESQRARWDESKQSDEGEETKEDVTQLGQKAQQRR
jgi:hypothetical protein